MIYMDRMKLIIPFTKAFGKVKRAKKIEKIAFRENCYVILVEQRTPFYYFIEDTI